MVEEYGDQLDWAYQREVMHALYDPNKHRESLRNSYDRVSDLSGNDFVRSAAALRSIEVTAYVFLLQNELSNLGYYGGSASGRFNTSTLRATLQFCSDRGIYERCRHGPLVYSTSIEIIRQLADARSD